MGSSLGEPREEQGEWEGTISVELHDDEEEETKQEEGTTFTTLPAQRTEEGATGEGGGRRRKIAFLAHGTLGDYLPAALVCAQLSKRGHDTIFMGPECCRHLVDGHPEVRFVDFGISMHEAREQTVEGRRLTGMSFFNHRHRFWEYARVLQEDWTPRLLQLFKEEKPDLLVLTIGSIIFLPVLLEVVKIPSVSLLANPMHMTGEHLPTTGPQVFRSLYIAPFNRFWWWWSFNNMAAIAKYHLTHSVLPKHDPPLGKLLAKARVQKTKYLDFPKLILCSPTFYPAPKDWNPNRVRVIGAACVPDEIQHFPRKPELEAFLAEHPTRTAYVGFGSMLAVYRQKKDRLRVINTCVKACLSAGLCVIVSTNGAPDFQNPDPKKVFVLGEGLIPHGWLFPRCTLIMHHGGSGTTHTALRAGRPQVIVPFTFPTWYYNGVEQGFWARQIKHAGVGSGTLHATLTWERFLVPLIKKALRPETVSRATSLAKQIRAEPDGLAIATDMLDKILQGDPMTNGVNLDTITTTTAAAGAPRPAVAASKPGSVGGGVSDSSSSQ